MNYCMMRLIDQSLMKDCSPVSDDFDEALNSIKEILASKFTLKDGETFGAEFLVIAKKHGLKIGQIDYDSPTEERPLEQAATSKLT